MTEHAGRAVRGYSKGMRQRIKLAQALVHDPWVLFLDEPFSGTDPVARRDLVDLILDLGRGGRTIVVSSHVLHEIEALDAAGRAHEPGPAGRLRRRPADARAHRRPPHRIVLKCPDARMLAAKLVRFEDVVGVELRRADGAIVIETIAPDRFYGRLPGLAMQDDTPIDEVYSDDDNLEAVFKYLVTK